MNSAAIAMHVLANELMADYAQCIDDDRLEDWLHLFTEDARYCVMPRENVEQNLPASLMLCTNKAMLRDRVTALRQANEYNLHYDRHVISGVRVRPDVNDTWTLQANYAVFQTDLDGKARVFSVGRYQDKVRLEDGKLLLCDKMIVVDNFSVPTLLATPL